MSEGQIRTSYFFVDLKALSDQTHFTAISSIWLATFIRCTIQLPAFNKQTNIPRIAVQNFLNFPCVTALLNMQYSPGILMFELRSGIWPRSITGLFK